MAAAGTLLADLDGQSGGDGDLVQKILSDMNIPTGAQRSAPPPLPAQTPVYQQQMASSTSQMNMDSHIPTSHMIGNEHPSPADFAAAMGSHAGPQAYGPHGGMGQGMGQGQGQGMPGMPGMPGMQYGGAAPEPSKNFYGKFLEEMKIPFVVAMLFFLFSLPPIRVLLAHYMPTLIKQTGEFHTTGLLAVSVMVGSTFWVLQRVIAPLLSL